MQCSTSVVILQATVAIVDLRYLIKASLASVLSEIFEKPAQELATCTCIHVMMIGSESDSLQSMTHEKLTKFSAFAVHLSPRDCNLCQALFHTGPQVAASYVLQIRSPVAVKSMVHDASLHARKLRNTRASSCTLFASP